MRRSKYGEARLELLRVASLPPTDQCIIWPCGTNNKGYPQVRWDGRCRLASHVLMEMAGSPQPEGLVYCHDDVCDGNRRCVNITHGRWDTQANNIADMVRLGRHRSGFLCKFTNEDLAAIRAQYAAGGINQRDLASQWGCHPDYISRITLGKERPA